MIVRLYRIGSSLLGGASLAAGVLGAALAAAPASANAVPADTCNCSDLEPSELPTGCKPISNNECPSHPCVYDGNKIYCDDD